MPEEIAFAELIGDPIGHSLSPDIHNFWLDALEVRAHYRASRVTPAQAAAHLAVRRADMLWRGCNVTAPLKQTVVKLLDRLDPCAREIGAVNCIVPEGAALAGFNTDVEGVRHALAGTHIEGVTAVVVGAGGAARAAIAALRDAGVAEILALARSPEKAVHLSNLAPRLVRVLPLPEAGTALRGAGLIINATPLGMAHAPRMPAMIVEALATATPGASVLDMVYAPLETPLLAAARAAGLRPINGLTMLIGQARRAFELFFGQVPPDYSVEISSRAPPAG